MATAQASAPKVSSARIATLKRRSDFLRVRKGLRWFSPAFVIEAKGRSAEAGPKTGLGPGPGSGLGIGPETGRVIEVAEAPRFGFTVTRQVGKAVERNRIRRRLKAAVAEAKEHAKADFDYVLIARRPALTADYRALVGDLVKGLERVHRPPPQGRPRHEAGKPARSKQP